MSFNVNDNLSPDAPITGLKSSINYLASQVKRLSGEQSWKDAPSTSITLLSTPIKGEQGLQGIKGDKGDTGLQGAKGDTGDPGIYKSNIAPLAPILGMYWDEIDSLGKHVCSWAWSGTYWISRFAVERGFNNGAAGSLSVLPSSSYASGILLEDFISLANSSLSGNSNSLTRYVEYRLNKTSTDFNDNTNTIAFNRSVTLSLSTRQRYIVSPKIILLSATTTGFTITNSSINSPCDNVGQSSHSIIFRFIR